MHYVIYGSLRYCSRHSCSQRCYCRTLLSCTYLSTMLDLAMLLGGFYLFLLLHWKVSVGRDCSRRRCVRCCCGRNAATVETLLLLHTSRCESPSPIFLGASLFLSCLLHLQNRTPLSSSGVGRSHCRCNASTIAAKIISIFQTFSVE